LSFEVSANRVALRVRPEHSRVRNQPPDVELRPGRYVGGVADQLLFTVEGAKAIPATRIALSEAGLTERSHLQE
jgi:hypothetical protein